MPGASPAQGITYIVQFPGIFRSIRSTLRGFFLFCFHLAASFLILTLKKLLEQNILDFFLKLTVLTEGLSGIFSLWVSLTAPETFERT